MPHTAPKVIREKAFISNKEQLSGKKARELSKSSARFDLHFPGEHMRLVRQLQSKASSNSLPFRYGLFFASFRCAFRGQIHDFIGWEKNAREKREMTRKSSFRAISSRRATRVPDLSAFRQLPRHEEECRRTGFPSLVVYLREFFVRLSGSYFAKKVKRVVSRNGSPDLTTIDGKFG
jgi:hypothetical protein